ncbi:MAG: 50S ribosomal protein L21e [Candidatus Aenigmatarchaeota archaeon]|nr:MAG: 50S ribosomal protein L21e [Candidatus Aenigmarchaeota archaeon]
MLKTKGPRQGTRNAFRKNIREKTTVNQFLRAFAIGDRVAIGVEPASHRALPHRRFLGKVGIVIGKRGDAYLVETKTGDKTKRIFITPEHIKKC